MLSCTFISVRRELVTNHSDLFALDVSIVLLLSCHVPVPDPSLSHDHLTAMRQQEDNTLSRKFM